MRYRYRMDELRRLNNAADSMDEPFGSLRDPFDPYRKVPRSPITAWSDRRAATVRAVSIVATSVGFLAAVLALLSIAFPLHLVAALFPGLGLIIIGAIAGALAQRARPKRVSVTQIIWRVAPSIGCLIGVAYFVIVAGDPAAQTISGIYFIGAVEFAGIGALAGIFCALGAWALTSLLGVLGHKPTRTIPAIATIFVGSSVGGLSAYVILLTWRPQTQPSALLFIVYVTAAIAIPVAIRLRRPAISSAGEVSPRSTS